MIVRSLALLSLLLSLSLSLTACPSGGGSSPLDDTPDAATQPPKPDAAAPTPDAPPLKGYGQACSTGSQCSSGLCIGETGSQYVCSVSCNIDLPNDCRAVDGFCVPIGGNDHGCFGSIDTLNDLDDAILSVGDSTTRALTPLNDADMFQIRLNQLGRIRFTVTPTASIDVKLEAYGMIGSPLATSNDFGPSVAESMETEVQQIGNHVFLVVRNVGTSTGNYTLTVTKIAAPTLGPSLPASSDAPTSLDIAP